ncbi:MAG: hypothetical protein ACLUW6_09640 [Coriobacteriaceae bacterium]
MLDEGWTIGIPSETPAPRRYIGDKLYFRAVPEGALVSWGWRAVASAANSPQAVARYLLPCAPAMPWNAGEPLGGAERKVL